MNSLEVNSSIPHDLADICIVKYRDHPSIVLIQENTGCAKKYLLFKISKCLSFKVESII